MKPEDLNQPRYYSTHALEDLALLRQWLGRSPFFPPKELQYFDAVTLILKESVKFILPLNGELLEFGEDLSQEQLDAIRLPYKTICLEFPCSTQSPRDSRLPGTGYGTSTSKRCVLAQETSVNGREGVLVLPIFFADIDKKWAVQGVHFFFPYHQKLIQIQQSEIPPDWRAMIEEDNPLLAKQATLGAIEVLAVVGLPTYLKELARKTNTPQDKILSVVRYESQSDFRVLAQFCNVMNCSNVELDTILPPAKLNKKRLESKKLPFFEYKVLTIAPGKSYSRSKMGEITDHRESPRQHLRRGHIRRYQSGSSIWITAHMVGDSGKGTIAKDYKVKTLS